MKIRHLLILPVSGALLLVAYLYGQATSIAEPITKVVEKTIEVVGPPPEKIEVSRQAMLRALEGKLELTTASMRLEKYVPAGKCDSFLWEDCITMVVSGKINAGFDWSAFSKESIRTTADTVTVDLGMPKIFDVVIDYQKTGVISQTDGLLIINPDKSLQMRTIAAATTQLRTDACHNGILKFAALEAEKRVGDNLRTLLRAAGDMREVKVMYKLPAC